MWTYSGQCGHILANVDILWTRLIKCGQINATQEFKEQFFSQIYDDYVDRVLPFCLFQSRNR
jgi:hypothetical protein